VKKKIKKSKILFLEKKDVQKTTKKILFKKKLG